LAFSEEDQDMIEEWRGSESGVEAVQEAAGRARL
jgi:hypothetical protein